MDTPITGTGTVPATRTRPTRRVRVGLGIAIVTGLASIPSAFNPTPDGQAGPPYAVLLLGAVLGLISAVAGRRAMIARCPMPPSLPPSATGICGSWWSTTIPWSGPGWPPCCARSTGSTPWPRRPTARRRSPPPASTGRTSC